MSKLNLILSRRVREKLIDKHRVSKEEVEECFLNKNKNYGHLEDTRADHKTDPVSMWFISETDRGRKLKIVWMKATDGLVIKTAYEPNEKEKTIYTDNARYAK